MKKCCDNCKHSRKKSGEELLVCKKSIRFIKSTGCFSVSLHYQDDKCRKWESTEIEEKG